MPVATKFLIFLQPSDKPFQDGVPTPSLIRSVAAVHHLAQWSKRSIDVSGPPSRSEGTVVIGRRDNLSDFEREQLREYNASLSGVTVHTYDWLIDVATKLQDWALSEARRLDSRRQDSWRSPYEGFKDPTKTESETS
jgi:hypothetical protein